MTRIRIALAGFLLVLVAVWAVSDPGALSVADSRALGVGFTQATGILSIGMMSFANLLAVRPRWLEPGLDGLDKMYRLHRWLGIGGLGVGVVHWLTATGEGRHGPPGQTPAGIPEGQTFLGQFNGIAHEIAQPLLFLLIALVAVALIRQIPYRWFVKTHILTVIAFLGLSFHSIVLTKAAYWSQPAGWLTAAMVAIGMASALGSGLRYFTGTRTARGRVAWTQYYPELHVLETELDLGPGWPGHRPGQFAFVKVEGPERAHPFTIATAWDPGHPKIGFITKELGDHTARMRDHFAVGAAADIVGPYGCFTFDDEKPRQIWIGGGIGITPFVAKMRHLAGTPEDTEVYLFHSTADVSELALDKMRADAEAAKVRLHILVSPRDGVLDFRKIAAQVPEWKTASVWFCGPAGFGAALRRDFLANGLAPRDFHQELFKMR